MVTADRSLLVELENHVADRLVFQEHQNVMSTVLLSIGSRWMFDFSGNSLLGT